MKSYQFLIIAGLLMSITSNVEDNYAMKVAFGMLSPIVVGVGLSDMIYEFISKIFSGNKK